MGVADVTGHSLFAQLRKRDCEATTVPFFHALGVCWSFFLTIPNVDPISERTKAPWCAEHSALLICEAARVNVERAQKLSNTGVNGENDLNGHRHHLPIRNTKDGYQALEGI